MTCAEAVRLFLLDLSPVTALVNQRIWTFMFPQSPTKPAVCVFNISDPSMPTLRGRSGTKRCRVQVDVIASTMAAARDVDAAILGDFVNGSPTGLRGAVGSLGSPASGTFHGATEESARESYEGDELKQAKVSRDYLVWYEA